MGEAAMREETPSGPGSRIAYLLCAALGVSLGTLAVVSPGAIYLAVLLSGVSAVIVRALPRDDRRFCLLLLAWGMAARIGLYGILALASWTPEGGGWLFGDSRGVYNYAWLLVQHLDGIKDFIQESMAGQVYPLGRSGRAFIPLGHPYGYHGMTFIFAALFDVFGPMKFSARLLNMFFGVVTGVLVYGVAKQLFGRRTGQAAGLVSVFWPSAMLWSVTFMKDSLYGLACAGLVWALLRLQQRHFVQGVVWIALAVALQQSLRPTMPHIMIAGVLILGILLVWLWRSRRRVWLVALVLMACAGAVHWSPAVSRHAHQAMREAVEYSRGVYGTGGSTYQVFEKHYYYGPTNKPGTSIPDITPKDFVVGWFRGCVYFLLVPFPWGLTTMQQLGSYPQMVLWYLLLLWVPVGLWRGWNVQREPTVLIAAYLFLMTSVIGMASGNIGTVFRHRDIVIPFVLMLSMAGLLPYAVPGMMKDEPAA